MNGNMLNYNLYNIVKIFRVLFLPLLKLRRLYGTYNKQKGKICSSRNSNRM